uniref:Uncharacterized protein LOC104217060 n=1 Tax=Nicotiana sylvestris TaxID=4096 RepID=A0A1U7VBX7_NICSY|nr:PREDICTED: uncharacterized protein LOC104217060 [Nicotiana sylvestris]
MVSNKGIEINPDKIKSIEEITVVNNVKAVQRLTERIAALGRFMSRSSDWSHHFFSLLKKKNNFVWTSECQQALEELKWYLSSPPLLHTLKEDEMLCLYLAVSEVAISGVLVREEQGRLAKWAIELGGYDIEYQPRMDIKSQILADFVADFAGYIDYLKHGKLPTDPKKSRTFRTKVARFSLDENGTLYRRTFDGPLAVCLGPEDTDYVLSEIHEGTCGSHSGADSLIRKAESTNKTIIRNIKKRLDDAKGKWREVLPEVLWAYRATSKSSTGDNPFYLVYGSEALIPAEAGEPSIKFQHATEDSNHEAMNTSIELLDEKCEAALIQMAAQKQRIKRYYNRRTNLRYFKVGDLVLRKIILNTRDPNEGKPGPNWEGPYHDLRILGKGSYKLRTMEGEQLPNNWNVSMLKQYYC